MHTSSQGQKVSSRLSTSSTNSKQPNKTKTTEDTVNTPPRTFHIPVSPPRKSHILLPRPSEVGSTTTQPALQPATENHQTQHKRKNHFTDHHSLPGNHLFCQHHLHQITTAYLEITSLANTTYTTTTTHQKHIHFKHHHTATINSTRNNFFQDHTMQQVTNSDHHYYLVHNSDHHYYLVQHIITNQSSQDHHYTQGDIPSYIPVIILTQSDQINNILAHQTNFLYQNHY